MMVAPAPKGGVLDGWLGLGREAALPDDLVVTEGLRFAFYGRTSTVEYQDPVTSRGWQLEAAEALIRDSGVIVAEFFDIGCSRRVPWRDRPQASALLAELAGPDRRFDAIVVGEFERAFGAGQLDELSPWLGERGVQVWLPEAGGPVEVGSALHQALVAVLGAQSQREVLRARHRTKAAMRAQVVDQGRYMGGRPPYGYTLVDAGPHPNRVHAQWGRRLRKLAPDPRTARHVRWIFAQRLAGRSAASIARELTERGVPCPSETSRTPIVLGSAGEWSLRSVIEILRNPRYTGRQVWNRTSTDRARRNSVTGRVAQHRNAAEQWVISPAATHPALVSEADFVAAQSVRAQGATSTRGYCLSALARCGVCGRRMDAHQVHGRAGYRCRHGYRSSRACPADAPRNLYIREDHLLAKVTRELTASGHDVGERADDLVAFLRAHDATVICDRENVSVLLGKRGARPKANKARPVPQRARRRRHRETRPSQRRRRPTVSIRRARN